jgi:hypothetical protein
MTFTSPLMVGCLTTLWLFHATNVVAEQTGLPSTEAQQTTQDGQALPEVSQFPPDQIEQLVAPIALYPDALLAQVLMAATYPLEIVQAERWAQDKANLTGEELEVAVQSQPWDPSVGSLVFFPSVLELMSKNLDWTQDLGDAVLAQQSKVLETVQRLRKQAIDAGSLATTEQQRVDAEGGTVVVQPADAEMVYVPTYDPSTVYGQTKTATTYYPASYTSTAAATETTSSSDTGSSGSDSAVALGAGALVGGLLTAAILRDDSDTYYIYHGGRVAHYGAPGYWGGSNYWKGGWKNPVYVGGDVNISGGDVNIDRELKKWEHNPDHRRAVHYRDNATAEKYAKVREDGGVEQGRAAQPSARPEGRRAQTPVEKPTQRQPAAAARQPSAEPSAKRQARTPAERPPREQATGPAEKPRTKPAQRPAADPAGRPAIGGGQRPARSGGPRPPAGTTSARSR